MVSARDLRWKADEVLVDVHRRFLSDTGVQDQLIAMMNAITEEGLARHGGLEDPELIRRFDLFVSHCSANDIRTLLLSFAYTYATMARVVSVEDRDPT